MLELILIRHGETAGNLRPTALGVTDLPLTERGRRQASTLARVFALEKPEAIYASPLNRAADTAAAIAGRHHIMVETVPDIAERHFGVWEGLPVDEIRVKYPEEYAAWQQNPAEYVIPQGESALDTYTRNVRFISDLTKRCTEGKVIIVTHLGCIRNMLAHLLGMGIEGSWHFQVNTGGICRLQLDENGYAVLTAFNEF